MLIFTDMPAEVGLYYIWEWISIGEVQNNDQDM